MNQALFAKVYNRGAPPASFINGIIGWGRRAHLELFEQNRCQFDVYDLAKPVLGPWRSILHRRAVMCEILRVLGMLESSGNWGEDFDVSSKAEREGPEDVRSAGAFQISYDSRFQSPTLATYLRGSRVLDATEFRRRTRSDTDFACDYTAHLLRITFKHNGPLVRSSINATNKNSVLPWLSVKAVDAFIWEMGA